MKFVIIGGDAAGMSAALAAEGRGARVVLATKSALGASNTGRAQGGIQAADKPNDSPITHYLDMMGGGHFTNDPDLVEALVKEGKVINSPIDAACDRQHEEAALALWETIGQRDPAAAKAIGIIKDWRKTLK